MPSAPTAAQRQFVRKAPCRIVNSPMNPFSVGQADRGEEDDHEERRVDRHDAREPPVLGDEAGVPALVDDADEKEQASGREAVVDHLEHAALQPGVVQREEPEHDVAEVRDGRVRDELLHVRLHHRDERAVDDADEREADDGGLDPARLRRCREDRKREAEETVRPHLQEDAGEDHGAGGGRLDVGVRQPRVEREHRDLDREADEEGPEEPDLEVRRDLRRDRVVAGGCRTSGHSRVPPPEQAGRVEEVEGDDREQHEDRADQGVEEELDGRVQLARAAPDADQEVHRDEHHFPEDVEEEEVEGAEDAHHPGLEQEEERVVLLLALRDGREARVDRDEGQERRQKDQERGDAVHPERVARAERRDPLEVLPEEEVAGPAEPLLHPERERDDELGPRDGRRHVHDRLRLLPREEEEHEGPGDRQEDQEREKSVHAASLLISG